MSDKLTYSSPALEWTDGLGIGNGSIGAMVWGVAGKEVFTLNHDHLFRNNIKKDIKTAHLIPKIRELMLSGKTKEAQELFNDECSKYSTGCNSYQVFGELKFDIDCERDTTDYTRNLNMGDAFCEMSYATGNDKYYCRAFSSILKNVIAVKYQKINGSFDCSLAFTRPQDPSCLYEITFYNNVLEFNAEFVEGVKFKAGIEIITDGRVEFNGSKLNFKQISNVELRIALATSYETDDVDKKCSEILEKLINVSFEDLMAENSLENKKLYDRVEFSLGESDFSKNTDEHYLAFTSGNPIDNAVYKNLFNAARYYTISASYGDSLPMNLQGIWNDSIVPMWECGYTTDLNVQMHYWLTLPGNLAECQMPLLKWLSSMAKTMERQAKNVFGCNGYYIPQYTDIMQTPTCWGNYAMFQVLWSGSAGWLSQHFYEYYKYTGDTQFLKNYALPFMRGSAKFYMDFLVKNNDGKYITLPSLSPENTTTEGNWLVQTSTIDISIINELFSNLIKLNDELLLNDEDREKWQDVVDNLIDYPINKDGVLEEWVENVQQADPYHRHLSHLYGLFPSKMFAEMPDKTLYNAAIKALKKRLSGGYGSAASWSHSWYACCFARIGDGDSALSCIDNLLKGGTLPNFLTTHNDWREQGLSNKMIDYKLIQIDALLGAATAIIEMFVQSDEEKIKIAPAVPKKWQESGGEIKGLKIYGGHEINLKWEKCKIKHFDIKWHSDRKCKIEFGMDIIDKNN